MPGVLTRKGNLGTGGECNVEGKGEVRVMHQKPRNAENCQQTSRAQRGSGSGFCLTALRTSPADTFMSDFQPLDLGDRKFLLFKPSSS